MHTQTQPQRLFTYALILAISLAPLASAQKKKEKRPVTGTPVIWHNPGNVSERDLRYGPGSERLAPAPPFTFIEEDKDGESPKFDVKDANGVEWKVKLGPEAQSETVSTRLVWSVGYFAEEAYYLPRARINGLPRLSRGRQYVQGWEDVRGARFEPRRKNVTRGKEWDWDKNPFTDTRELDGLKVIIDRKSTL